MIRRQTPAPAGYQPTGLKYSLVKPIFVKSTGHLCNDHEQAIVPVRPGDIVVQMTGSLPITDDNPDAQITGQLIREIGNDMATIEPYPLTFEDIPVLVIRGAEIYHNRNGAFFCDADAGNE